MEDWVPLPTTISSENSIGKTEENQFKILFENGYSRPLAIILKNCIRINFVFHSTTNLKPVTLETSEKETPAQFLSMAFCEETLKILENNSYWMLLDF